MPEAATPRVTPAKDGIEAELDLAELIERHENIDWSDVPGVSAAETAAWTARLIEARDAVLEGGA